MKSVGVIFTKKKMVLQSDKIFDSESNDITLSSFIIMNLTGIVINFTQAKIPVNFKAVSTISPGHQRFDINPLPESFGSICHNNIFYR